MSPGREARPRPVALRVLAAASAALLACVVWAAYEAPKDHVGVLSVVLAVAAVAAGLTVAHVHVSAYSVSASFLVALLAAAFLGPASAFVAVVLAELVASRVIRTRPRGMVLNIVGLGAPVLAAAVALHAWAAPPDQQASFYFVLAGTAFAAIVVNYFAIGSLFYAMDGGPWPLGPRQLAADLPAHVINVALVVAGASIYVRLGTGAIVFALAGVFAFAYMAHLLEQSRRRAQQYVSLSWGVLAGLLRSLDVRDQRAARHAAAVARFARDIARAVGMSEHECELAHTAGLLHDIGRFALSDRVAERGRTLTDDDWCAIQRHPELGADLLRDLGMYGPVAEIVLGHHERIDGRGYPNGLEGSEIPEIAKIISVAEVYDALTASDTYRTRMSSFEALRELRRVAGSQLDERYVEVLAQLLSGEGVDYRHADSADFDSELDMERRIKEAAAGA